MSRDFFTSHGFSEDPFASTNAANEPLIENYFVDPPFFPAVIGDPRKPMSNVVFAPRGGGKTAQKIMIEKRSAESRSFLCIAYDKFPTDGIKRAEDATADYHLNNITRIILLAIVLEIDRIGYTPSGLNENDKKIVVELSKKHFGKITSEKYKETLNSIKSLGDRSIDAWNKYGGVAASLVNVAASYFNLGKLENKTINLQQVDESARFQFESAVEICRKIGFNSVYILIDRVDELTLTASDAEKSFTFLKSILIDLPLLETEGVAFKFFLWDQSREAYQEAGGRPDRLLEYTLDWKVQDLQKVLSRRLQTYSSGKIFRFDQLLSDETPFDIHALVSYLAHGSPRDMVRICKKIVDEHTKTGAFSDKIEFRTVKVGISAFSLERARELYGSAFSDLRKIESLNFTINYLASDVFRVSQQAVRTRVKNWQSLGAVAKIGDVPNPGNRPQYLFGITDPRLALAVNSDASLEEALKAFLIICPHCQELRIAEEGAITCPDCSGNFEAESATTLGHICEKY
ncbi:P-loop ATPase, Sll1717 family [Methylobacterium sp.]|uniref:P-loop ATPase, Sll1717 family n=1 Tax=Methylobacterium sp. TaxID=409 RepID=UPI00272EE781|nr:hypothetical protein [Methylobacterium sp.]